MILTVYCVHIQRVRHMAEANVNHMKKNIVIYVERIWFTVHMKKVLNMVGLNVSRGRDVISVEIIILMLAEHVRMKKEVITAEQNVFRKKYMCAVFAETIIGAVIVRTVRVHGMMRVIVN